ncbi:MAG: site-specific integrase, partial [Chloroflexi bacterium]|nr:site-specific integrase [Chloroflexota bacterium]
LYAITLGLGLRQGEALALNWSDVDLEKGVLTVRHTLQRYDRAYHRDEPKTKRSRRTIAVPAPLVDVLRSQRIRQLEMRMRAGPAWSGNPWDLVFTTELGEPVSGSVVTHHFQRLLASAGLPRQRFHDLRHAAASFMLARGVPRGAATTCLVAPIVRGDGLLESHVSPEIRGEVPQRVSELP